jgi:mycothiol synthase
MIIRPGVPADLPGIQRICAEALDLEPDARELPSILQAPRADAGPAQQRFCLVAETDGEITGVCYGSLGRHGDDGRDGHVDLLAVGPQAQLSGVGHKLLAAAEDRLASLGATCVILGGNPPVHLWPGVDVRYRAMTCLAERAGYSQRAEAVDMAVNLCGAELDTTADESRLAAAGIAVRRASPAEAHAVVAWLREGPWGQSAWPDEAASALARDPVGCHVASREDYLGFACHGAVRRGWFGPMGTLDTERGRGIGAVLLKRCLADMRAAGLRTARIGWVGPVQFYANAVDARVERVYGRYWKKCSGATGSNSEVAG